MRKQATGRTGPSAGQPWLLILGVVALALAWQAWLVNQRLACWAGQWPQDERSCASKIGQTPEERVDRLKARLKRNPGDARAAVELAFWASRVQGLSENEKIAHLEHAARLAPNDRAVVQGRAQLALERQTWSDAVPLLTKLATVHQDRNAASILADLVGQAAVDPALQSALLASARADAAWMDRVVPHMAKEKIPVVTIMPLVNEAIAHGQLPARTGQTLVRMLKTEGLWLEAHAVWAYLWKQPLPYLFNGDFEQAFTANGFDWDLAGSRNDHRAGARVSLVRQPSRGQVLHVDFTGRNIQTPIVRQHVILPPASYRMTAQWLSTDLRSPGGLTWRLSCVRDRREIARSAPMNANGRTWSTLEWSFSVPADCGLALELALVPAAAYEARTGMRGEVMFDHAVLTQTGSAP